MRPTCRSNRPYLVLELLIANMAAYLKQNPGAYSVWLSAARPRTLPLAVATIGMGAFLAASHELLNWPVVILTLITALLLQILSNLANDYGDARHGADHAGRAGPKRTVQSGQIRPKYDENRNWLSYFALAQFLVLLCYGWPLALMPLF